MHNHFHGGLLIFQLVMIYESLPEGPLHTPLGPGGPRVLEQTEPA